jgi:hypothetical protein
MHSSFGPAEAPCWCGPISAGSMTSSHSSKDRRRLRLSAHRVQQRPHRGPGRPPYRRADGLAIFKEAEVKACFLRRQKSEVASGMNERFHLLFFLSCLIGTHLSGDDSLWDLYESKLKQAKYVDLTHTITPSIPAWSGFGQSKFAPAINPETNQPYVYAKDVFEATRYELATDQLGTQLDPPAIGLRSIPRSTRFRPHLRKGKSFFMATSRSIPTALRRLKARNG